MLLVIFPLPQKDVDVPDLARPETKRSVIYLCVRQGSQLPAEFLRDQERNFHSAIQDRVLQDISKPEVCKTCQSAK